MAIVDVDNAMTAPKGLTSASGIDVMTHAIEAYVSIMATDYTDGLAMKAVKLVFDISLLLMRTAQRIRKRVRQCTMRPVWPAWHLQMRSLE